MDVGGSPLVSVIMPVYNAEPYLHEAVESILAQTLIDFEFIILNDGSSDGSHEIVSEYARRDSRIIYHRFEKNRGLVDILNYGLSLARGEFIGRMDADDISLPKRLENQIAFLEKHPEVGVLGGSIQIIDCNDNKLALLKFPETNTEILWSFCYFNPIVHPSVMMRRQVVLDAGCYRSVRAHAEDYDLWIRLSKKTQFANLPQVLLELRKHETNITVLHEDKTLADSIQISHEFISYLLKKEIPVDVVETIWNRKSEWPNDVEQAAKIIIDLYRYFCGLFYLESSERRYLQKETSRYLVRLISGNTSPKKAKKILLSAMLYNPSVVVIYLLKTVYMLTMKSMHR